ncbi:MAG: hypothetical protein ACKO2P_15755 [Planctomycetota bacterium]
MSTIILFVCGCILCLLFLGTLYADHVHVGFLFEGRWLGPLFAAVGRFWISLADSVTAALALCFNQLSWVVAACSGGAGLLLILFLLGGGIAADAEVWTADLRAPLKSGGVLDQIPGLSVRAAPQLASLGRLERDDSDLFASGGGRYLVFNVPDAMPIRLPPRARLPLEGVIPDIPPLGPGPGLLRPRLLMEFRRRGGAQSDIERFGENRTRGILLADLPESSVIDRALRLLSFDGWRPGLYRDGVLNQERQEPLEESTAAELRDIERGVRIYAGGAVSSSDIEIDKRAPEVSEDGMVQVELRIRNQGQETIDGLIVRERLPRGTQLLAADPPAVWRDDELVWRLDDFHSDEDRTCQFTVRPAEATPLDVTDGEDTVFVTETIVSALLAVTSPTDVEGNSLQPARGGFNGAANESDELDWPGPDVLQTDRRRLLPDISRLELSAGLNVQLQIRKESEEVAVGAWTSVFFNLENRGETELAGVQLRVTLDENLEHPKLRDETLDRAVVAEVGRMRRGETRQVELKVRPRKTGFFFCTAEVLSSGVQAGVDSFDVICR